MTIAVLRQGDGPPTVLLHGFTGAPASWAAAVEAAPGRESIAALALPGHHPELAVASGFSANVAAVASRIRGAELAGGHLIGYSLGARVALALLVEHPGLAARATLIGAHPGLTDDAVRARRATDDRRLSRLLRASGVRAFVAEWEALPMWQTQQRCSAASLEAQQKIRLGHDADGLAACLDQMGLAAMPDFGGRVGAIAVPVELVAGGLDDKFTTIAATLAAAHPQITHRAIAGAGHNVVFEAPASVWRR